MKNLARVLLVTIIIATGIAYFFVPLTIQKTLHVLLIAFIPVVLAILGHSMAHGYVAYMLGDDTAVDANQVFYNPFSLISPIGTILAPMLLIFFGHKLLFGWSQPLPTNLSWSLTPRQDILRIAVAGPIVNLIMAFSWALLYKSTILLYFKDPGGLLFQQMCILGVQINSTLLFFNLIPLPPFDGSRVFACLLPRSLAHRFVRLDLIGIGIVLALAFSGILDQFLLQYANVIYNSFYRAFPFSINPPAYVY